MKNKSCGFFNWYDKPMNERVRDVINELKDENKRLVVENMNLGNSGRCSIEGEVAELWVELKIRKKAHYKQEGELNSARRKMRVAVVAALFSLVILLIFVTWL